MAINLENQLKQLKSQEEKAKSAYVSSPTVGREVPTAADIARQRSLLAIQGKRDIAESELMKQKWYGEEETTTKPQQKGFLGRALDILGAPLYGVVGATEAVLGKGTKKGVANIIENIREKETFGDLLRKYNLPNSFAMPLGFALDVFGDPVNWLTMGTAAFIPKVGYGALKAGLTGAKVGAEAGALEKVASLSKLIPTFKSTGAYASLMKKTVENKKLYNELVGRNVSDILRKSAEEGPALSKYIFQPVMDRLKEIPGLRSLGEKFDYDPRMWYKLKKYEDLLEEAGGGQGKVFTSGEAWVKKLEEGFDFNKVLEDSAKKLSKFGYDPANSLKSEAKDMLIEGAELATDNARLARAGDAYENIQRLAGEVGNEEIFKEVIRKAKSIATGDDATGIKIYDYLIKIIKDKFVVRNVKVGEKILDAYSAYISLFKTAAIGGSPSTWVNAIIGNPTMAFMMGMDITSKGLFDNVGKSFSLLRGKMKGGFSEEVVREFGPIMELQPSLIKGVLGVNPEVLTNFNSTFNRVVKEAERIGKIDTKGMSREQIDELKKGWESYVAQRKALEAGIKETKAIGEVETLARELGPGQLPISTIRADIENKSYNSLLEWIKSKAEGGNIAAKAANWYLTKPLSMYEKFDQSYKLGTAMTLIKEGVSEASLMTMKRFVPILPEDIIFDAANNMYKFKADKALEIVNDMYMNYSAMPAAVKMFRSLPFFGSPFFSFMYAMLNKTAKTAAYNPAAFNKIQFLLNEVSGGKSPLEQAALSQPYYQWYNQEGMVSLPFFENNRMYLNVANFIPYYTMNMFQPSERKFDKTWQGYVTKFFDKVPLMKTPEAQLIFDYFVQPLILQETNPKGMFDQTLWPKDATTLEKTGYATRSLIEALIPSAAAGLGAITPESMLPFAPKYQWRKLGYALRGKTPVGVSAKEASLQRTLRAILSTYAGLSFYPVDITYASKKKTK